MSICSGFDMGFPSFVYLIVQLRYLVGFLNRLTVYFPWGNL